MGKETSLEEIFLIARRLGSTMIARGSLGGWYIRTKYSTYNIHSYSEDGPTRKQKNGITYLCPSGEWDIDNYGGDRRIEDFA
jgi:hypothetical protein